MDAEQAIRLMDEGNTLVNYKDGVRIKKNGEGYIIMSANADTVIIFDLYKTDRNQIWGKDYAIRFSTSNMVVLPEEDE